MTVRPAPTGDTPRLVTERLILEPLAMGDVDDVTAYQSIAECVRYVPFDVRDRVAVTEALEKIIAAPGLEQVGGFFVLGMRRRDTGRVIGQVNIGLTRLDPTTYEFGYLTHRDYWRQGYTLEAVSAVIDWAVFGLGAHRLTAIIIVGNDASVALAERLGMRREATHIAAERQKGELISEYVYAILAEEWRARSSPSGN